MGLRERDIDFGPDRCTRARRDRGEEDNDPLHLLGLSISDQDTTTVFPSEFGVFDRFDLDHDLATRLQEGLPDSTTAEVSITAVEGNYVNWARGGNFNPSGQVRVPSLRGDGTGVFAATVSRRFVVVSSDQAIPAGLPDCPIHHRIRRSRAPGTGAAGRPDPSHSSRRSEARNIARR